MRPVDGADRALYVAFFALALFTVAFRSSVPPLLAAGGGAFVPDYHGWLSVCVESGRPCLRATSAIVALSIEGLYGLLAELFYRNVADSPFYGGSQWGLADPTDARVFGLFVPVSGYVTFIIVSLLPLLAICKRLFDTFVERAIFLFAAFSVLIGWHPVPVNLFFALASELADWPRSYYLFSAKLLHYDFGATCVLALALVYLARPLPRSRVSIAVFAALAQATFENLGIVFAAGVFFAALAARSHDPFKMRARRALIDSAIAVGAAVATGIVLSALFFLYAQQAGLTAANAGDPTGFLSERWWVTVENNFAWIKTLTANVINVTALPAAAGIVLGVVGGWRADPLDGARHDELVSTVAAGAGLVLGFLFTLAIGLFFIAYPAEMGRQTTPLAVIIIVPAAKAAELAVHRLRRRLGAAG